MNVMNLSDMKLMSTPDLHALAKKEEISVVRATSRQNIIFALLEKKVGSGETISGSGVLEILPDNYGFLRDPGCSYRPGPDDIYVSPPQIRRFNLRNGDVIEGNIRPPKDNERYFALKQLASVNGEKPGKSKILFEDLTPLFPHKRIMLARNNGSTDDVTARVLDLVSPVGKGQRGLIVAPPKAGKTTILQLIAQSIEANNPEVTLMILLVDERPEEVTEMRRMVKSEVVASTFDEPASNHVHVAEMVIEKARRMVEHGRDVVILMDSMTRLARAYNTIAPSSGKVLTGGVDANALHRPKRVFGAARNVKEGGSLTILSTILVDTGSKMDEVIYEEFKGTGNMEVHLDRRVAEKRVFPAININRSGTRREELITKEDELKKMWILRKILHPMDEIAAIEFLLERLKRSKSNDEFFDDMKGN
jgi:transcription termination factor Rho